MSRTSTVPMNLLLLPGLRLAGGDRVVLLPVLVRVVRGVLVAVGGGGVAVGVRVLAVVLVPAAALLRAAAIGSLEPVLDSRVALRRGPLVWCCR